MAASPNQDPSLARIEPLHYNLGVIIIPGGAPDSKEHCLPAGQKLWEGVVAFILGGVWSGQVLGIPAGSRELQEPYSWYAEDNGIASPPSGTAGSSVCQGLRRPATRGDLLERAIRPKTQRLPIGGEEEAVLLAINARKEPGFEAVNCAQVKLLPPLPLGNVCEESPLRRECYEGTWHPCC